VKRNPEKYTPWFRIALPKVAMYVKKVVKPGIYRHFKGGIYVVLGTGKHTETGEEFVVYMDLYKNRELWLRPKDMFLEVVEKNGKKMLRFEYLG
jgi:hypothetical protein